MDVGKLGSGRGGQPKRKKLPLEYAAALDAKTLTLDDLKDPIIELGHVLGEYDLTKWQ